MSKPYNFTSSSSFTDEHLAHFSSRFDESSMIMFLAVLLCFISAISRTGSVIYQLKGGPLPDRVCVYLNRPVVSEDVHEFVVNVSVVRQPTQCQWNHDSTNAASPNDRRTILIVQSPDHCSLIEQWIAMNSKPSARRYLAVLWAGNSTVAE